MRHHDLPLYETRVVNAPITHNLEDPPRVVGLERVLHRRALVQGDGEGGVAPTVGHGHDAVLVGRHGGHDAPVEPRRLTARVARVDVALTVRKVLLKGQEIENVRMGLQKSSKEKVR
jgi:hypothetical protein